MSPDDLPTPPVELTRDRWTLPGTCWSATRESLPDDRSLWPSVVWLSGRVAAAWRAVLDVSIDAAARTETDPDYVPSSALLFDAWTAELAIRPPAELSIDPDTLADPLVALTGAVWAIRTYIPDATGYATGFEVHLPSPTPTPSAAFVDATELGSVLLRHRSDPMGPAPVPNLFPHRHGGRSGDETALLTVFLLLQFVAPSTVADMPGAVSASILDPFGWVSTPAGRGLIKRYVTATHALVEAFAP